MHKIKCMNRIQAKISLCSPFGYCIVFVIRKLKKKEVCSCFPSFSLRYKIVLAYLCAILFLYVFSFIIVDNLPNILNRKKQIIQILMHDKFICEHFSKQMLLPMEGIKLISTKIFLIPLLHASKFFRFLH